MKRVPPRALVAALVALSWSCVPAAGAQAFSLTSVQATPGAPSQGSPVPDDPVFGDPAAAGAHPDLTIELAFARDGADSVAALRLDLAPGIVSYINHVPVCDGWDRTTQAATACPESIVGATRTSVTALVAIRVPILGLDLPIGAPLTLDGTIYRIPSPDPSRYPAALGIDIAPPLIGLQRTKLESPITVDPRTLGLTATLEGLPDEASGFPIHIDAISQILYGYTPTGRSFFTNPTACIPAAIAVTATSHAGATSADAGGYTPTDCAGVPFDAALTTTADPATPDSTSAISFDVQPSQTDLPRASSHVRGTTVIAPPGVLLNSSLAAGLDACTDAGFQQQNTAVAADCPPSSRVGGIEFVSPILRSPDTASGAFAGTVYFGTQTATDRLRLFLDVPLYGAHIKVAATVNPDYTTGQITTRFTDLPQIAFTDFRLTFNGGPRSALVTPTSCGENVSQAIVGPWSGGPAVTPTGSFRTDGDCDPPFSPSMGTSLSDPQAGADTAFTLTYDRPDRTTPVGRVTFDLPPGLIGALGMRGLTKCPVATARAGGCPDSSRIGSVASVVGSGGEPPTLPGSIYLTEPQAPGDPAGLSVKVPAQLGPVDAGTVIVAQQLILRNDGSLRIVSEPIPALQFGIPLAIRRLTVTVDRRGFMRNPSSCGVKPAGGLFEALGGGRTAPGSSSVTVTGCERLPFAPRIRGEIGGRGLLRVGRQPRFVSTITQRDGEAAMRSAQVTLPRAVSTNLPTLRAACPTEVYAARSCPRRTVVATARAVSPLIARPLRGDAYLVRSVTGGLPRLLVELRGEASLDLEGIVTIRRGLVVTTFGAIPDLPISSFQLSFRGGREGVLSTVGDLCARPRLVSSFVGQNGKRRDVAPRMVPLGCTAPRSTASLRFRRGAGRLSVTTKVPSGAKPLASMTVALPRGLTLANASASAKAGRRRAGRGALRISGRSVALRLPRGGARAVTLRVVRVGAGGRVAGRLSARRGRLSIRVATRQTNRARASQTVRVRLR